MNKLMTITNRLMDTAGEGGGGASAPSPAPTAAPAPAATEGQGGKTETVGSGDPAPSGGSSIEELASQAAAAKPFLGEAPQDGGEPKQDGEQKTDAPKEAEITEQSYIDGIKKDEKLLGNEKAIQLDQGLIKAIAPTLKECGISVENANKLANALAAAQVSSAREAMRQRVEYFESMKKSAMEKYAAKDWETINAGINAAFKADGVMNHVVRHSELGADPEFLALMYEWGKRSQTDGVSGAAAAGGVAAGDPNSTDGIAKLW